MFEVQIFAPLQDNEGIAFSAETFGSFESKAVELLGGFTLYPAQVIGGWRDESGRDVRDHSRVYSVALSSLGQGAALVELVTFARQAFRQDAIFIRYLGEAEIIS